MEQPRDIIFISHANPEDNDFALWLTLHLAREGYKVWCDKTSLLGGEVFWIDIEEAIRNHTIKFIFVLSKYSNSKEGPRKELAIAETTQNLISNRDFIVPIKIDDIPHSEMNIEIHRRNAIPFSPNWADGFDQLLKKLESESIPKAVSTGPSIVTDWWRRNFSAEVGLKVAQEEHLSNWFKILAMPKYIFALKIKSEDIPLIAKFPVVPFERHLFSFASLSDLDLLKTRHGNSQRLVLEQFLQAKIRNVRIIKPDARRIVVQLLNEAWNRFIESKKLPIYLYSDSAKCSYFPNEFIPDNKIKFVGVNGPTYRQVSGIAKESYWHYGIRARALLYPHPCFELKSHVLFSDDGQNIWQSKERLHRKRRSQCKNWWNDEWRDRILAVVSWLSDSHEQLCMPISAHKEIIVETRPLSFISPLSYTEPKEIIKESNDFTSDDFDDEEVDQ